ncbi:MAG: YfhO family protein [Elusimicrobia bacterium]|nr:YfhO family protein [Elusimicrobiota bacterium]
MTIGRRDGAALGALFLVPLALLSPSLLTGRVFFLNDLTHVSHPWRVLGAELAKKRRLPMWDPSDYSGLPFAGNMQTGLFEPLAPLFSIFPFGRALTPYFLLVFWLGSLFTYLQLRRLGARPGPAAGGALLMAAGGTAVSQMQFPHLLATLAGGSSFLLFAGRPALLALSAGIAFLCGYPPLWSAWFGAALLWQLVFGGTAKDAARSALGMAAGLAVAAFVVLPGAELAGRSGRAQGRTISAEARMTQSADWPDLLSVIHPALTNRVESRGAAPETNRVAWTYENVTTTFTFVVPAGREHALDPGGARYSHLASAYLGVFGAAAALLGLAALAGKRPLAGAAAALFVVGVLFASLGGNHPVSAWLWTHAPYLKQLRGPASIMYLVLTVAPALVALGLGALKSRRAAAALWLAAMTLELAASGWSFHPLETSSYWTERGPLAALLRGDRYFLQPETELWPQVARASNDPRFETFKDVVYRTYKGKLFGLSNLPYHLEAASGSYEPLVPSGVDAAVRTVRDGAQSRALADMLAWLGCRWLLTKDALPPQRVGHPAAMLPGRLLEKDTVLWHLYETPGNAARARWLAESDAGRLSGPLERAGEPVGRSWTFRRPREDRFEAEGEAPSEGRVFLPEPYYPGWRAYVDGEEQTIEPALEGFSQVRVDGGKHRVAFAYRPGSFLLGLLLSLAALAALARRGFNKMTGG